MGLDYFLKQVQISYLQAVVLALEFMVEFWAMAKFVLQRKIVISKDVWVMLMDTYIRTMKIRL